MLSRARFRRLVGVFAIALPTLAAAQPTITGTSINGACPGGSYCGNYWSTVPGAYGNWEMFLSTDAYASFYSNPLAGITLSVGTNTIWFSANLGSADPMALNVFLDGATLLPSISGYAYQSVPNSLLSNAGAPTYDPYSVSFVVPAAPLSWTSGNYTTTLTRFDYEDGRDYVAFTSAQPDGFADWNGVFDLEVVANVTPTPEPASMTLVAVGLLVVAGVAARRRQ